MIQVKTFCSLGPNWVWILNCQLLSIIKLLTGYQYIQLVYFSFLKSKTKCMVNSSTEGEHSSPAGCWPARLIWQRLICQSWFTVNATQAGLVHLYWSVVLVQTQNSHYVMKYIFVCTRSYYDLKKDITVLFNSVRSDKHTSALSLHCGINKASWVILVMTVRV